MDTFALKRGDPVVVGSTCLGPLDVFSSSQSSLELRHSRTAVLIPD